MATTPELIRLMLCSDSPSLHAGGTRGECGRVSRSPDNHRSRPLERNIDTAAQLPQRGSSTPPPRGLSEGLSEPAGLIAAGHEEPLERFWAQRNRLVSAFLLALQLGLWEPDTSTPPVLFQGPKGFVPFPLPEGSPRQLIKMSPVPRQCEVWG